MRYLLSLFLLISSTVFSYEQILNICAIFKNESRFLKEWIDYHRTVGVEEFWLYNNNSEDDYLSVLNPYIDKGIVHLVQWPSRPEANDYYHHSFEVQTGAYNHCLKLSKGKVKWLALIDIDEFIVPVVQNNIPEILEGLFPDVSGLCLNWVLYGTSYIEEIKSNESMLEKLIMRAPISHNRNLIYKSIVQPLHVKHCNNPHFCSYLKGHWHVNTNREFVNEGASLYPCIDKLRINHYWTRDEKFFREEKIPRYMQWGNTSKEGIESLIQEKESLSQEVDKTILRFLVR
jgi:hypothetical protein